VQLLAVELHVPQLIEQESQINVEVLANVPFGHKLAFTQVPLVK